MIFTFIDLYKVVICNKFLGSFVHLYAFKWRKNLPLKIKKFKFNTLCDVNTVFSTATSPSYTREGRKW